MGKSASKNPMVAHPVASPSIDNPRSILAREEIHNFGDPDLPELSYPQDTVCSRCGAVYHDQRWSLNEKRRDLLLGAGTPHQVVCPGCVKIQERNPQGIVTLRGDYWARHHEEILNLARNEEARGLSDNPLARIIDVREEDGRLVIETTNAKLAQKIGRSIDKAHNGELEYQWGDNNQFVRVEWERSLNDGR
jgi:hypothetical protein